MSLYLQPLIPLPPTVLDKEDHDNHTHPAKSSASISPQDLYQLLTQHPDDVLVLDCRPRAEFNASHPDTKKKFPQWLCVPEETIKNG